MRNRITVLLSFILVTTGYFISGRAILDRPDFRDAPADMASDFDTGIPLVPDKADVPVPAVPYMITPPITGNVPISNFGVAIWKDSENGKPEGLLFRGATPEGEAAFRFLGGLGVKTVINLQVTHTGDKELCAANGIECLEFRIVPSPTVIFSKNKQFLQAFKRAADDMKAGRKVFIHCQGGRHRTGALVTALALRNIACGKSVNKTELGLYVEKMLKEYGFYNFYGSLLAEWEKEIRGWADNFEGNQWICE